MESKGGLSSLLKKGNATSSEKKKTDKPRSFTLTIYPETIAMFNEIQWLQSVAIDYKKVNRNDVLKSALEAYKKQIGFDKLMKDWADKMPDDISPDRGR